MITVAVSAALGQDRIGPFALAGRGALAARHLPGVGSGRRASAATSLTGDLMVFGAVCCWAAYTLGSRPLMGRHSPVAVNGLSMALGTALYLPLLVAAS